MNSNKVILLFGMPRSGTTWIGKLFDSHKDTNYLHEPDSVEPDYKIPLLFDKGDNDEEQLEENIYKWLQPTAHKVIASSPFFKKSYMRKWQWLLFLFSAYMGKACLKLHIPILKKPIRLHDKVPVTVWKSIESLGRMHAIQTITGAKSIHIIRHPCGQIASTLRGESMHEFDGSIVASDDWNLFEKLLKQSGEKRFSLNEIKDMYPEERLAVRWGLMNDHALHKVGNNQSIVLIYEDLCRDPKEKILELFGQVGLNVEKETLKYLANSIREDDSSYYSTTKSPLIAAYKWKEELTSEKQNRILEIVKQFDSGCFYLDDF